jgi:hypothetical protein
MSRRIGMVIRLDLDNDSTCAVEYQLGPYQLRRDVMDAPFEEF